MLLAWTLNSSVSLAKTYAFLIAVIFVDLLMASKPSPILYFGACSSQVSPFMKLTSCDGLPLSAMTSLR